MGVRGMTAIRLRRAWGSSLADDQGVTLVEIMIAITILTLLTASVGAGLLAI